LLVGSKQDRQDEQNRLDQVAEIQNGSLNHRLVSGYSPMSLTGVSIPPSETLHAMAR